MKKQLSQLRVGRLALIAATCILTLAGCTKENVQPNKPGNPYTGPTKTARVTAEKSTAESKVTINDDLTVHWVSGDGIIINTLNDNDEVEYLESPISGNGGSHTVRVPVNSDIIAFYPNNEAVWPNVTSISPNCTTATVVVPTQFNYSNDNLCFPMMVKEHTGNVSTEENIVFHQICGILEIVVLNSEQYPLTLKSITVTAEQSKLAGEATVAITTVNNAYDYTATPTSGNTCSTVTVNINNTLTVQPNCSTTVHIPVLPFSNDKITVEVRGRYDGSSGTDPFIEGVAVSKPAVRSTRSYSKKSLRRAEIVSVNTEMKVKSKYVASGVYFTVAQGKRVAFSKGNLQYQASSGIWRLAPNQWNFIGANPGNTTTYVSRPSQSDWIDLFGWATSGCAVNNGIHYQPWRADGEENQSSYYGPGGEYGNPVTLTGEYANCDWGVYNPIQNAGNASGMWRVLSIQEWQHIFGQEDQTYLTGPNDNRDVSDEINQTAIGYRDNANLKWTTATINTGENSHVCGTIIIPDEWPDDIVLNFTNQPARFDDLEGVWDWHIDNIYTTAQWQELEEAGAIFLPFAGMRYKDRVTNQCQSDHWTNSDQSRDSYMYGNYWSSTGCSSPDPVEGIYDYTDSGASLHFHPISDYAHYFYVAPGRHYPAKNVRRCGRSVRLVYDFAF